MSQNPSAFPVAVPELNAGVNEGMSLRDWFAGQALAGMQASHAGIDYKRDANRAYGFADAMLAERSKASSS